MLVCQAWTSFAQPQSKSTVPPRFGSRTSSTPCSPSQLASSTIAAHVAPVRCARPTASARWSTWPWVTRIVSGSSSSAVTLQPGCSASGRDRSATAALPSLSSKQEWPRKRMSVICRLAPSVSCRGLGRQAPRRGPSRPRLRSSSRAGSPRRTESAPGRPSRLRLPGDRIGNRLLVRALEPAARSPAPRRAPAVDPGPRSRRAARLRESARHRQAPRRQPAAAPRSRARSHRQHIHLDG